MFGVDFEQCFSSPVKERTNANVILFCFPYAGAGVSSYHTLCNLLPLEVIPFVARLPGRETTHQQPPFTEMSDIVSYLSKAIRPALGKSSIFFWGHSMGALLAFEIARIVQKDYTLDGLIVSGHVAPHLPVKPKPVSIKEMDDAQFLEIVRSYGGMPDAILQNPDILQLVLPQIRADLTALEGYQFVQGEKLESDIFCINGQSDHMVDPHNVMLWQELTSAKFSSQWLPGSHFFINEQRHGVVKRISNIIRHQLVQIDII